MKDRGHGVDGNFLRYQHRDYRKNTRDQATRTKADIWFSKVELLAPNYQVETFEAYLPRKKVVKYNELGGSSGTSRNTRFTKNVRIRLLYRTVRSFRRHQGRSMHKLH